MPDGFLYVEPVAMAIHLDARIFCSKIPGHRLAMFKTEAQKQALYALSARTGRAYNIDLTFSGGNLYWGDGTQLGDAERQSMDLGKTGKPDMKYDGGKFSETDHSKNFLCQANPNGLDW
ncbi:uncharacterized protein LOC119574896 [Penaeus monodon]|uniref:uncharacterized protein LOC119574896 n=1 Tax=Penaeus monodon TaxID=6687 RepID=UPI0018A742B0|nr:uncharacterized protein LOC119574896 [Penaeus monodon]